MYKVAPHPIIDRVRSADCLGTVKLADDGIPLADLIRTLQMAV